MNDSSSVDNSTAVEIATVLKSETDTAWAAFKDAKATGDLKAIDEAWVAWSCLDDAKLQFVRAVDSVKGLLVATQS